ncbi:NrfD/PsrC family molybdoenzyme membrane anchor subunit [Mongoliitalea lutea]|uniref:Uncharacterized protein n=1 Tax=Mongoliitalea lutea TaxID=849756 RepID=A0A8J3CV62_9BACT|nr:NrfD/PsrC family molybdoenzyme membrane anchor subunit [Mongoliitalea lutea]GHB24340.1 hypothetical protein GCM10008106_01340 [Mongoliitalea lutea]
MESDKLQELWNQQGGKMPSFTPQDILQKAKKQRKGQYISITVLVLTVLVLSVYTWLYAFNQWNSFNLGLLLMISSLVVRVIIELLSIYRKESRLVSMDHKSYHAYLKKYYGIRRIVNYLVTPVCVITYIIGYTLLLPYFKEYFSQGFYTYIQVSGAVSIGGIIILILYSIVKEERLLKQLQSK